MAQQTIAKGWPALAGALLLAACGGGGDDSGAAAGPSSSGGSSPILAVGRIDAFGSVFVNGVEFETSRTTFRVDDRAAFDDSALSVGMIVRVSGRADDSGRGTADEIRFDDEVEGPVSDLVVDSADATRKRFKVLGLAIVASSATTVFRGDNGASFTFDDLSNGDHVEVSGDFDGDTLAATFIKLEDDNDFEVKGTVSNLTGNTFVLTLRGGATLNATLAPGIVLPSAGFANGAFVEVEGTIPDATKPQDFLVTRIEIEDEDDLDGDGDDDDDRNRDRVDIEGVLSAAGDTWSVGDTELKFLANTEYRPASLAAAINDKSAAGLRVRVRGPVVDGVVQVQRIRDDGRADGADDLELKGFVEKVTPGSGASVGTTTIEMSFAPAVGTVNVLVNADTLLMDDDGMTGLDLTQLTPDVSFIEVHGFLDAGVFTARVLEVEDDADEYEVEGPLDANGFVANVSISALGVKFTLDAGTVFEDGTPSAGDSVDIEDFDRDGFADSVEIED
jgi:hypothetical protein